MDIERNEASSALERLCARVAASRSRPYAILGCSYPFDGSMFGEILDSIREALLLDDGDLTRIPIEVVCDRNLYRGHALDTRYQVHLYPQKELFHPKLLLVLLEHEVVWLSGSGNLTRAGYCSNREIALLHEPGDLKLPAPLRRLLARLPGDAARTIREATEDARPSALRDGRFVSSVDGPIGPRFLARAPGEVVAIYVLAPFFESVASSDTLDAGWLNALRTRFPHADYRFYLPCLEPGRKPCVQGDRALFERFAGDLTHDRLAFYPVPPAPGDLHAKLVAIVYRNSQGRRARILVGSPNPSRRALLLPRRNVEVGWIAEVKASSLEGFLSHLAAGDGRPIEAIRFEPPTRSSAQIWSALSNALLDPEKRTLTLTWADGHGRRHTDVFYGKRYLDVQADDRVRGFELDAAHGALTTRPKRGRLIRGVIPGHCPIEMPLADQILLGTVDEAMKPEDWLALWGCDPATGVGGGSGIAKRKQRREERRNAEAFAPSEQVRDLAARIRHTLQKFRVPFWSDAERDATLRVLEGTFDSHDPSAPGLSVAQRIWRGWVRAEMVQFAATAARDREVRNQGLGPTLRTLAGELRRRFRLGLGSLPRAARKQVLLVAKERV